MEASGGGSNLKAGTVGGTVLVLLLQLRWDDVMKTMVLAGIGAVVSYVVSATIRWIVRKVKRET